MHLLLKAELYRIFELMNIFLQLKHTSVGAHMYKYMWMFNVQLKYNKFQDIHTLLCFLERSYSLTALVTRQQCLSMIAVRLQTERTNIIVKLCT